MNGDIKHQCVFSGGDVETLKTFCALLRNGGLKALRELVELGEAWAGVKHVAFNAIAAFLLGGILSLIALGFYVYTR